ncbi:aspartyl/glutamyl-tRNA(Asn/Gln) amidotransferase subunit C [Fibrobacterales bacterium]|nr:aspartyl/glutamyl-tRNA(Asn/Gln) amidotransferase subunit C [Fibrobacterales bacterium]
MSQEIDIEKLSVLSRLTLSEEEKSEAAERLKEMLKLMENLRELDLSGVEPMSASEPSVLREDVARESFTYEQTFLNAPQEENRHFVIPKVM